ncbi:MAG: hypothetical protein ACOH5I_10375 [Oligoflexus sp.]
MTKAKQEGELGKLLIVGALCAVVFLWFRQSDDAEHEQQMAAKSSQEIELIPRQAEAKVQTTKKINPVKQVKARRRSLAQRRQLKLQSLSIHDQDPVKIPVSIKARSQWCQVGDLDLMKAALKKKKDSRLIMTLEPTTATQNAKIQVRSIGESELHKGFSHVFELSKNQIKGGYGLYICLDSQRQGTCRQKAAYPIHDLGNILFNAQSPKRLDRDPVFYFQMLLSDGDTVDIFASNQEGDDYYNILDKFASTRIPQGSERRMALTQARRLHQNLSSVPAMVKGKGIEISLPYMDPKCLTNRR